MKIKTLEILLIPNLVSTFAFGLLVILNSTQITNLLNEIAEIQIETTDRTGEDLVHDTSSIDTSQIEDQTSESDIYFSRSIDNMSITPYAISPYS